jgi:hypothetical protein
LRKSRLTNGIRVRRNEVPIEGFIKKIFFWRHYRLSQKVSCLMHVSNRSCCMATKHNRCLRNILGIWWPVIITNQELWERTRQSDIYVKIKRRKIGSIGHTLRKSENDVLISSSKLRYFWHYFFMISRILLKDLKHTAQIFFKILIFSYR